MGFFKTFFETKRAQTSVLVSVNSTSVTGACVYISENEASTVWYAKTVAITPHHEEHPADAMLRALRELLEFLIREGSPVLLREIGTGTINSFFISLGAPWQETAIRTERIEHENTFLFNRSIIASALQKSTPVTGKVIAHESVVGTILNGYEVRDAYDARVHRAEITILTSLMDPYVIAGIRALFKELYFTRHIRYVAEATMSYQIICTAFPHTHNALIIDAHGNGVTLTLLRKGILAAVSEVLHMSGGDSFLEEVKLGLTDIAKQYVLPRTIFLLAPNPDVSSLQEKIALLDFKSFWFSDTPPTILTLLPTHVIGSIRWLAQEPPDVMLIFMVRYWQRVHSK